MAASCGTDFGDGGTRHADEPRTVVCTDTVGSLGRFICSHGGNVLAYGVCASSIGEPSAGTALLTHKRRTNFERGSRMPRGRTGRPPQTFGRVTQRPASSMHGASCSISKATTTGSSFPSTTGSGRSTSDGLVRTPSTTTSTLRRSDTSKLLQGLGHGHSAHSDGEGVRSRPR